MNKENWLPSIARREAQQWFKEQCQNPYAAYYLFYACGDARITTHQPGPEWELASQERIKPNLTQDQVRNRAYEILRKCPCLPAEEE